jgi:hypothetical protein
MQRAKSEEIVTWAFILCEIQLMPALCVAQLNNRSRCARNFNQPVDIKCWAQLAPFAHTRKRAAAWEISLVRLVRSHVTMCGGVTGRFGRLQV